MFEIGELIVYGSAGVCEVIGIGTPPLSGVEKGRDYYFLRPHSREGVIYAPVDTKVFMRTVISREEALALIEQIPEIHVEAYNAMNVRQLTEHYEEAISSHSCLDLLRLTMSIHLKKQFAEQNRRRIGLVDERYMKRAENLLFGEFAVALGIPFDQVPGYIQQHINP